MINGYVSAENIIIVLKTLGRISDFREMCQVSGRLARNQDSPGRPVTVC